MWPAGQLGTGYTLEDLLAVLAGQKSIRPARNPRAAGAAQGQFAGGHPGKIPGRKGAGYARWAKVFNLKQMAQTVNYLTEHHLLDYAELEEKRWRLPPITMSCQRRSRRGEAHGRDRRPADPYRQLCQDPRDLCGLPQGRLFPKFREEHEEEILLHQAAKNAFDELNVKKLPKVKDLQSEYAKLLEKRKNLRRVPAAREEMRELLTVKANVDRVLKMDEEPKKNKKKTTASGKPVMVKSVHRNAQPQNEILRSKGLGGLPSTSAWGYLDSHKHCLPLSLQK